MDETAPTPEGKRDETGKFSREYQSQDFLTALRRLDGSGSTKEIADEVGCVRRTAYNRLRELEANQRVSSREVGRSILWQVDTNGQ